MNLGIYMSMYLPMYVYSAYGTFYLHIIYLSVSHLSCNYEYFSLMKAV